MRKPYLLFLLSPTALAAEYPPEPGVDRESSAYFSAAEQFLESLDLEGPGITFKRLGGTTATNWEVFSEGVPVANLKCSSGNTNHHGAVVTYRLGRELDFNIYPVAVYRDVDLTIDDHRVSGQCALKGWSSIFTQYYWTRDTFADTDDRYKRALVAALDCRQPAPGASEAYVFSARSAYGDPKPGGARRVPYRGDSSLSQAASDFSTMMVVDELIGNEDRFPGGNTFFRSVTTTWHEDAGSVVFDDPRIYSLDNEASFKGRGPSATHAASDLRKHVWRFDADIMSALSSLRDDAKLDTIAGDSSRAAFMRAGIDLVLEQYTQAKERCGEDAAHFD